MKAVPATLALILAVPSGTLLYKKQQHHVCFEKHRYAKTLHLENEWKPVSGISILQRVFDNNLLLDVAGANTDILSLLAMLAVINPATRINQRASMQNSSTRQEGHCSVRKDMLKSTNSSHTAYT